MAAAASKHAHTTAVKAVRKANEAVKKALRRKDKKLRSLEAAYLRVCGHSAGRVTHDAAPSDSDSDSNEGASDSDAEPLGGASRTAAPGVAPGTESKKKLTGALCDFEVACDNVAISEAKAAVVRQEAAVAAAAAGVPATGTDVRDAARRLAEERVRHSKALSAAHDRAGAAKKRRKHMLNGAEWDKVLIGVKATLDRKGGVGV